MFAIIFFNCLFSEKTYVLEIPTEIISTSNYSSFLGVNDNNEVLIQTNVQTNDDVAVQYAFWSKNKPLFILKNDLEIYNFKNNIAFGRIYNPNWQQDWGWQTIIWTHSSGAQKLDAVNLSNINLNANLALIDANSCGQIIGSYQTKNGKNRVFIWENGKARDLNIDDELYARGYQVFNIYATRINNHGNIFGSFDYGYKHPLKDQWIKEGAIQFVWNGQVHFITIPEYTQIQGFNNDDEILFWENVNEGSGDESRSYPKIFAWHFEKGPRSIMEGSHVYTFNDCGQMLVAGNNGDLLLVDNNGGSIDLQKILNDYGINHSYNYHLNNNGVIVGLGKIWNEYHVFMLRPV